LHAGRIDSACRGMRTIRDGIDGRIAVRPYDRARVYDWACAVRRSVLPPPPLEQILASRHRARRPCLAAPTGSAAPFASHLSEPPPPLQGSPGGRGLPPAR